MKVLELLDELDEIIEVASSVPVVRKVMVDPNEVTEIVKEIRLELPDEIQLVENDEITVKAKARADEILRIAQENSQVMKMSILDYTDSMLYNLQEKVDQMYATYFTDMYDDLQATFDKINNNIATSRNEVKEQIYKSQVEKD